MHPKPYVVDARNPKQPSKMPSSRSACPWQFWEVRSFDASLLSRHRKFPPSVVVTLVEAVVVTDVVSVEVKVGVVTVVEPVVVALDVNEVVTVDVWVDRMQ